MRRILPDAIRRLWRGAPVIVVSGLPRSGTSMVMSMLASGGVEALTDGAREADADNPRGYFELEQVMALAQESDRAWLREARGKAVKIISHLLKYLPQENDYRIVLVERALPEVIASQNRMLTNRGEENPVDDAATQDAYAKHLIAVRAWAQTQENCRLMTFQYRHAVEAPHEAAQRLQAFIGVAADVQRMAAAVDASLYRKRGAATAAIPEGREACRRA